LGVADRDDVVVETVEDQGGLAEIGEILVAGGVFDEAVADLADVVLAVVKDSESVRAAPAFHFGRTEALGPAAVEAEGGGEEDQAADRGVAGGEEAGQPAAHAGADQV